MFQRIYLDSSDSKKRLRKEQTNSNKLLKLASIYLVTQE